MSEDLTAGLRPEARLRLLESILGSANDAVIVTEADPTDDPGPRVVYVNEAFTRMTGYAAGEIAGKTPRVLQGPGTDRGKLYEVRAALGRRESVRVELLNYRKDGTEFWVELDIVPVGGEGSRPDYWLSVQRETTECVQAERERRESERRLRSIVAQYGSDMITILDSDGTSIYESPQVERTLGYQRRELAGGNFYRHVHPDDAGRLAEAVERTLQTPGVNPPVEYRIRHAAGSWLYFESIGNNLVEDPEVNAIVVNTRDITRRKQVEEALARERNLLEAVMDSARDAIFVNDHEHRFTLSNRAHMEIHGARSREEILGKTSADFRGENGTVPHHADNRRMIETGEPIVGLEEAIRTASGEERWLSTTKAPLRGPEDRVEGVVAISRDITERRRAEQALREI